jgi:microcystin-dependent protein
MGAVNTTYTFTATDTITSTKMNNIIDQTTMTGDAILGTTLEVADGKLKIRSQGITSNEFSSGAVNTNAIADGAVTQAKASNMLLPAGVVSSFAGLAAGIPTGWLYCDGQAVSRTTYSALFAMISTIYGAGNGSTTFNVPDLRGAFIRGWDSERGLDPSRAFGSYQDDSFASHTHTVTAGQASGTSSGCGNGEAFQRAGDSSCGTSTTSATGSTETRPKNYAMDYCIKY